MMLMLPEAIKARITENLKATEVILQDLTGTRDHWHVVVVSPLFDGQPLIKQHRMVIDLFSKEVAENSVHALSVKTFTPEKWERYLGERNGP